MDKGQQVPAAVARTIQEFLASLSAFLPREGISTASLMLSVGAHEGGLPREKQLEAQLTQTGAHREDSLLTSLP